MKKILFAIAVMSALPLTADAEDKLALFQTKNITYSGLRNTHTIALTFDDGPNAATIGVLDALKAMHIKATFFIVGKMAKAHPEILARIPAEGHLLANHSATHPLLTSRYDKDPRLLLTQLRVVHNQISPLMQPGETLYFRAPFGSWRPAHAKFLNADPVLRDYVGPIYWDVGGDTVLRDGYVMSSADWDCWRRHWTAQVCAKGYLREIRRKDGGVVLMHSINSKAKILVRDVIPALKEEGYTFVRLDQIPEYKQYETPKLPSFASAGIPLRTAGLAGVKEMK